MQAEFEYWVALYRGSRCVGGFLTQEIDDANERSRLWNSHGEGHTSRIERRAKGQAEARERIPENEYLTQDHLRDMFR